MHSINNNLIHLQYNKQSQVSHNTYSIIAHMRTTKFLQYVLTDFMKTR